MPIGSDAPPASAVPPQLHRTYAEKLHDPRWYTKREEVFERDEHLCVLCSSGAGLQCHHRYYLPYHDPWDYPLEAFEALCATCHGVVETLLCGLRQALESRHLHEVYGFVLGLRSLDHPGEALHVGGARVALGVGAAYGLDPGGVVAALQAGNWTTGARLSRVALLECGGAEEPGA